jgi:hypothetical protein
MISKNFPIFVIDKRLTTVNSGFLKITLSLYSLGNYWRAGTHDVRGYKDANKENCYYYPKDIDIIFHLFKQLSTVWQKNEILLKNLGLLINRGVIVKGFEWKN